MSDRRRRWAFWTITWGSLAALGPAFVLGVIHLARYLGTRQEYMPMPVIMAGLSATVLSLLISDRICRRLGLHPDERTIETLVATRVPPEGTESVQAEGFWPAGTTAFLLVWMLGYAAYFLCLKTASGFRPIASWLLPLVTWGFIAWIRTARLSVTVDEEGIARRLGWSIRPRRVRWSEVASCTIESTTRDTLGLSEQRMWVFHDPAGRELLRVPQSALYGEGAERVLATIGQQLGLRPVTAELIAADPPEGTGTEPEAGSAPEGTGTELQAEAGPATGDARAQGRRVRTP